MTGLNTWTFWRPVVKLAPDILEPDDVCHFLCVRQPTDAYKNLFPMVLIGKWKKHEVDASRMSKVCDGYAREGKESYLNFCQTQNRAWLEKV